MEREVETIEIQLLLEGIYRRYGYDFRDYVSDYILRRVHDQMERQNRNTISEYQSNVLHQPACFAEFLLSLSIQVTAMFRNPGFYLAFRQHVVPQLREMPFFRIWHAGCSTGEEVFSMAILLKEVGLYDRCRIYATDMNEAVLEQATSGIFPLASMQAYTTNYLQAGGLRDFSQWYTAQYNHAIFHPSLKQNMVFAQHNLVTDRSFNEFHVIICRNVMIYFNKSLQIRVLNLLYESLSVQGILGLGSGETIHFTNQESCYTPLTPTVQLYRKWR